MHELYGYKLNNQSKIDSLENTGSVLVEETWNSCEYSIPEYGASIKMVVNALIFLYILITILLLRRCYK